MHGIVGYHPEMLVYSLSVSYGNLRRTIVIIIIVNQA